MSWQDTLAALRAMPTPFMTLTFSENADGSDKRVHVGMNDRLLIRNGEATDRKTLANVREAWNSLCMLCDAATQVEDCVTLLNQRRPRGPNTYRGLHGLYEAVAELLDEVEYAAAQAAERSEP